MKGGNYMNNQKIVFNPKNYSEIITLMDKYGDSKNLFFGENENGESITLDISHDKVMVSTLQKNGWERINIYHRDGTTEETYKR